MPADNQASTKKWHVQKALFAVVVLALFILASFLVNFFRFYRPHMYLKFDGGDFGLAKQHKTFVVHSNLDFLGNRPYTISMWVKLNEEIPKTDEWNFAMHCDDISDVCDRVGYKGGDTNELYCDYAQIAKDNEKLNLAKTQTNLGTSNFHHIVCTYDSKQEKLYLDGGLKAAVGVSGEGLSSSHGNIFTLSRAPYYSSAAIRRVIVENRAWTAQQVKNEFDSGTPNPNL